MHGFNFTERVRKVLAIAREETARLGHEYVGTEHILLAILKEGEGSACAVLRLQDISLGALSRDTESRLKPGFAHGGPDLPYTSKAKKVLECALAEARELQHSCVGTEHLLLGLLREGSGIAAAMLAEYGVELGNTRTELLRLLREGAPLADAPRPRRPRCIDCRIEMVPFQIVISSAERTPIEAYSCPQCGVLRMFAPPA